MQSRLRERIVLWLMIALAALCALVVWAFNGKPARAETVTASWYGGAHHGRRTASGERFNMHAMTAAHRRMPFGTRLRVCRRGCVAVRVNDRGPFVRGRGIDLSAAAARAIGLAGVGRVTITRK